MVNYVLEYYKGVNKSYRYNLVFKVPIANFKSYFLLVSFLNLNIVKGYWKI